MNRTISLKWRNKRSTVKPFEIIYIEAYNRHIFIYSTKEMFKTVGKMDDFCSMLPMENFARIHQGFTVNMNMIECINAEGVKMKNNVILPVSVRKKTKFIEKYDKFCESEEN